MSRAAQCHGVLISYRRPTELAAHLGRLAAQTTPLATLLVVDNDDDDAIRTLVTDPTGPAVGAAEQVRYLGLEANPGPAGGIAAGIEEVLTQAGDDDWIVLLDDDDPPPRPDTLEALQVVIAELSEQDPRLGAVGLWGAELRRTGRLRAASGSVPEPVAYLPGGACPHYRVSALRRSGGPDPDLFFGFDDLDLGLAIHRQGNTLWSSGLAREHGWASMVDDRRIRATVDSPSWRRYYSLRNLVIVLRNDGRTGAALTMSMVAGLAKPLVNLALRPATAWAALRLNIRALRDGWSGRAGKTLDPQKLPAKLQ